jgi:hypothetical protein
MGIDIWSAKERGRERERETMDASEKRGGSRGRGQAWGARTGGPATLLDAMDGTSVKQRLAPVIFPYKYLWAMQPYCD